MSKTFCILPWVHTHIKPNGDVHLCSRKSIPLGNLNNTPIDDILNSSEMNEVRRKMLNGEEVTGCEKCYHTETISKVSLRKHSNLWFKELMLNNKVLDWGDILTYDGISDYNQDWVTIFKHTPIKLKWIAIHASNICNLSCRGCYSGLSSKWRKDEAKLGINPYPLHNDDLDKWGLDFKSVDYITMFGGEPLVMKQNDQLMDQLLADERISEKVLQYYTNCTVMPDEKTMSVWKQIKKLQLFLSIDGFKEHNDYFRHGSKWHEVEANIRKLKEYADKYNWDIKTTTVINIHNVENLEVLHNWLITQKFKTNEITHNLCIFPQELDIRNLPDEYKETIRQRYKQSSLPNQLKDLVLMHLGSPANIDFLAVTAFSRKLDTMRNETNPLPSLDVHMNNSLPRDTI